MTSNETISKFFRFIYFYTPFPSFSRLNRYLPMWFLVVWTSYALVIYDISEFWLQLTFQLTTMFFCLLPLFIFYNFSKSHQDRYLFKDVLLSHINGYSKELAFGHFYMAFLGAIASVIGFAVFILKDNVAFFWAAVFCSLHVFAHVYIGRRCLEQK